MLGLGAPGGALGTVAGGRASPVSLPPHPQMLSFMHAQYSFFQQGRPAAPAGPLHEEAGGEVGLREEARTRQGRGPLPSLYPSPTAGLIGD